VYTEARGNTLNFSATNLITTEISVHFPQCGDCIVKGILQPKLHGYDLID
jgi:hypothetical protein